MKITIPTIKTDKDVLNSMKQGAAAQIGGMLAVAAVTQGLSLVQSAKRKIEKKREASKEETKK